MQDKLSKNFKESIRYTMAYYAGNVALSEPCRTRLKENMTFLRDYVRRGYGRDALGCMVENIFLGDMNDRRYAAVIRWYERRHPGAAALIVSCLDDMAEVGQAVHTVERIRGRLRVQAAPRQTGKIEGRLKRIVGLNF